MTRYLESRYRKEIDSIITDTSVMTLAFQDDLGPWTAPVYYSGEISELFFLSSPRTRHGIAITKGLDFAASIFQEPQRWQQIRGLQLSGNISPVEDEKGARASFLKKFPFVSLFLAKNRLLDPLIKEKTEEVIFYRFLPAEATLVDNAIKFGFHHKVSFSMLQPDLEAKNKLC